MIDFTATEGDRNGEVHLGIYELGMKPANCVLLHLGNNGPLIFRSMDSVSMVLLV